MTKEALERAFIAGATFAAPYGSVALFTQAFDRYWQEINEEMANGGPTLALSLERSRELMADWGARHGGTGDKPAEPFDFGKLPRPGDANYKPRGVVVVATTDKDQDGNSIERPVDLVEYQEAANFAAFDPDAFVPHADPNKASDDDH